MWYVDDSKVSHKDPEVVTGVLSGLERRFGELTIKRGKEHTFVGMDIKFNNDKTVTISMPDYIKECIESYRKVFNGGCTTPAKKSLFEIDEKAKPLNELKKNIFHHIVANYCLCRNERGRT